MHIISRSISVLFFLSSRNYGIFDNIFAFSKDFGESSNSLGKKNFFNQKFVLIGIIRDRILFSKHLS